MVTVSSTPVELIDDNTAQQYYNDLDTLEGAERESRAEALRLWADQKDADQKREQFDTLNKIYTDFDSYVNDAGLQDFDEESRYRTANRQFIASQFDDTVENQQTIYPSFRDKWTESVAGKKGLSEKETFGLIKQGIDARNKVSQAADEIPGDIALALFDSLDGGDPVDVPKLIDTWKTKNAEAIKKLPKGWETPLLEAAQKYHTETDAMLRDYAEPLKQVYDHFAAVTRRDTEGAGESNPKNQEEMDSMVDTLASMPKPVRERAYASVVLGAKKAGQDPKTFMENWGESWSRTLNMVRTGALTAQEMAAESEARQLEDKQNPPDYYISKSTGEKIPLANRAFYDEADLRKVTPEEIAADAAKARQKVKRFEVVRELQSVADNEFDPIEKINKGGFLGFMESMAYGTPQSLAYTGTALIPFVGPYLAGTAIFADEYNQLREQGMSVDQAVQVGSVSAGIQAGLERTGAELIFGKLPVFEKLMRRIANPARVGKAGSAGIRFFSAALGENITEGAQDLTTPLVQDVAEALGADVPDVQWQPILEKWSGSRLDVLAATIPTILLGTGVATFGDNKRFAQFEERQDIYRSMGMDDATIKEIEDGKDISEKQQKFQTAFSKLTSENVKAGVAYMEEKIASAQRQQQDPNTPTLTRATLADGTTQFIVRDEQGRIAYRTAEEQSAQIAMRELLRNQITGSTRGIVESLQFIDQVKQAINRGEDVQKLLLDSAPRTLLDDYEANPTEQNLDNLFATVRAFGQDISEPAELANFPVLASNQGALAEGIFKSVIRIQDGATGVEVMRDFSQDNLKRAIAENRVTMDWVREQLNQVIPLIESDRLEGRSLRTETDTDVIESFSDVAVAYMTGRIRDEQIPAGFRGFLRRMAIVVKDIFRRAYKLKRLVAEGKVDANFEALLAESVGLNQQTLADTVRDRAKTDLVTNGGQMLMDFSIGSRASAVSNDTPALRAGNATVVSPTNFSIGAYHGTPHKVDKFSTEKIGTGEGAQVYGWGLYFAENPKVAQGYRDQFAKQKDDYPMFFVLDGQRTPLKDAVAKFGKDWGTIEQIASGHDFDAQFAKLDKEREGKDLPEVYKRAFAASREKVNALRQEYEGRVSITYDIIKGTANLYTVDLDVEPEDLLDWDKPFSEQSPKVQAALQSISGNWLWQDAISGKGGEQVGGALYSTLRATFPDAEFSRDGVDASKKASEALFAAGIPGIRYLDQGSRAFQVVLSTKQGEYARNSFDTQTAAESYAAEKQAEGFTTEIKREGTYNYVIFDESKIKITGENGQPVTMQDAQAVSTDTGATNYSISVQTTAANILADRLNVPTTLGKEYAGRQIIPIEADLTAGGGSFTQKPAQGGPAFSVIPEYFNAGVAWAAAKDGFWTGKLNLARESGAIYIGKDGREKFMVAPYAMKQDSHISNPTVAGEKLAEVARYVAEGRISPEQEKGLSEIILKAAGSISEKAGEKIEQLTNEIPKHETALEKLKKKIAKEEKALKAKAAASGKELTKQEAKALGKALKELNKPADEIADQLAKAVKDLKKFKTTKTMADGLKTFPTTFVAGQFDQYLAKLSFEQRAFIAEKLSSAAAEKLGAPPMEQIRRATLDESFSGTENLSLISLLEIDVPRLEKGLKDKTLTAESYKVTPHNSYNSLAPGRIVAMFRTPIPYALAFPDIKQGLSNWAKAKNKADNNHGYYLKGKIPEGVPKTQEITSQMLNLWSASQTNLRPNQAKAIVAALNQKWTTFDKPRQAGLAEFTRAIRNNDAAVTLTQYSEKEVSQLLKAGTMKVYRLGEMNVWFALKRPTGDEFDPGDPAKDWTIVSVINNEKAAPGVLPLIMSKALAEGGTRLDCYAVKSAKYPGGLLPTLYARSGFEPTANYPFDESYHTEPGKMGELEKVWHSQNWDGQNRPPLVYMKWNPELHANIGTNRDAVTELESSPTKDASGMAEGEDTGIGRVSKSPTGDMGGAGQGVQGRGVSDGSSPTGDAGNARNILPRGIEQIVADLGKLNDYQLQALGLTKSEVDEAIGIYNDPNSVSYSIASQSEIDRVNKALGGMNRGPDERLKVYERAREKFSLLQAWNRDELQAMQETGADATTIRRSQILQGLGELDAILSILPPEVRGRVGGYTKLASIAPHDVFKDGVKISEVSGMKGALISAWMDQGLNIGQAGKKVDFPPGYEAKENLATARADRAIADFFRDRIKKIDAEFEKVVAREYRNAILDLVKKSRPKAGDNNVRKSTLGAETQKLADMVQRATLMDEDAVAERMLQLEQTMATSENSADMVEEWGILNQFGDLKNRNSETLAQAYGWFKDQLQMGREAWRIKEEARIAENRERAKKTVEFIGGATAVDRFKDKTFMDRVSDWANHALLDHASFEQFVTALFPPDVAADFSTRLRKADIAAQKAEIDQREGILNALREGAKAAGMTTGKAMEMLKTEVPSAVRYLDGRKVKNTKLTIEQAEKIVRGEIDRGDLTDTDVRNLSDELAALPADTRKENITLKQVVYPGKEVRLPMTRGKAIQLLLSWNQPDVQDKMRREGWNEDSIADLRELTSDPVSKAMIAHAQELYGKGAGIVNPVYARMFGMNMPQVKNYAPTRFLHSNDVKDIGLDGSPVATGTTPGFAKSRVSHSAKIAPEDALSVMQQHILTQAHWVNFAELAREYRSLINNPEIREAIKAKHGTGVLKTAELWADQMEQRGGNQSREAAWVNAILGSVIGGQSVASLGFNLKTLAMQLDNSVRFALALDKKQIMAAMSSPDQLIEDIKTVFESDALQTRLRGGATAETRYMFERFGGKPGTAAKVTEAAMSTINWMDTATTSFSAAIVYRANLNEALEAGMPESLARETALDAAAAAIYRFAQPVSFGQKSNVENSGNIYTKAFFLFMSDPRLKTAIIADAVRGLATGRGDKGTHIRRLVAVELMAVLSHVVASAYRDAFTDDEDEEIWSRGGFVRAIALAPLQGFFFAGTMFDSVLSQLTGAGFFTPTQNPLLTVSQTGIRALKNADDILAFDDPDALLKEWSAIARTMAVAPAAAMPAVLLNAVKPIFGAASNAANEE